MFLLQTSKANRVGGRKIQIFALRAVLRRCQDSVTDRENGSTSGGSFFTTVTSFSFIDKALCKGLVLAVWLWAKKT